MKRRGWCGTAAVLIAAMVGATMPAAPARAADAGDDSTGAAITIGLMFTVVVVYGLVSLRSDVERYTQADKENAIAHAARLAEESPIVLQTVAAPIGMGSPGAGGPTEIAGAAIGWRVSF